MKTYSIEELFIWIHWDTNILIILNQIIWWWWHFVISFFMLVLNLINLISFFVLWLYYKESFIIFTDTLLCFKSFFFCYLLEDNKNNKHWNFFLDFFSFSWGFLSFDCGRRKLSCAFWTLIYLIFVEDSRTRNEEHLPSYYLSSSQFR